MFFVIIIYLFLTLTSQVLAEQQWQQTHRTDKAVTSHSLSKNYKYVLRLQVCFLYGCHMGPTNNRALKQLANTNHIVVVSYFHLRAMGNWEYSTGVSKQRRTPENFTLSVLQGSRSPVVTEGTALAKKLLMKITENSKVQRHNHPM